MSVISIILVVLIAFLAGIEGILDEFQFHQPLIACTLIGLVTGNLTACIILGGTLQMIALGWANIGGDRSTRCRACLSSFSNYISIRWTRGSRYSVRNRHCNSTCSSRSFLNNDRSYIGSSNCSLDGQSR